MAEAFRPSKDDTTKVSQSTQVLAIDTLSLEYNTADTLAHILTDIEDEVQQSRTQRQKRISRQAERLRYANIEMSHRLAQLFENIEQDEQERAFKEATAATALRQKTSLIFVAVTVASVLLAIVFFILVWKDNQRSNHYRKELEKAKNKAEGLLIAREKLMLTITHDIKAPAGSILGYLDLLSPLINEKKPVFYIKNIKSAATHLLNLVNSLLDYHRLEAQKMDINPVSFNPAQLMKTIYENFIPAATQKELLIHYEQTPDTDCTCRGDAFRIRQITENLISNAIKFTDKGSISLSIQLKDNKLSFQVRDTGCGMTSDEQNRIFQEFTRLQSAQGKEGFGLGLSITHKLVELLNGTIDVESARGKGTCFNVNLPIEITSEKNIISEKEANYTDKTIINCNQLPETLKILIIDDDQIQLQLTKAMFEQWKKQNLKITNWNIVTCTHPKELLDIIRKERFNVLLTDIQMPALNGIELLKTIRQTQPSSNETMPVIALTARQDLTESDFKEKGFATCLYKPFNINDLAIALNKAINIHKEYMSQQGYKQCKLYDGIDDLLKTLKNKNIKLAIATLKQEFIANQTLKYLGIDKYFDMILGQNGSESLEKSDLLKEISKKFNTKNIVLIGDTKFDAEAALKAGIDFIAVTYGMGFRTANDAETFSPVKVYSSISNVKELGGIYVLK